MEGSRAEVSIGGGGGGGKLTIHRELLRSV